MTNEPEILRRRLGQYVETLLVPLKDRIFEPFSRLCLSGYILLLEIPGSRRVSIYTSMWDWEAFKPIFGISMRPCHFLGS
jgi:hypothetical protein